MSIKRRDFLMMALAALVPERKKFPLPVKCGRWRHSLEPVAVDFDGKVKLAQYLEKKGFIEMPNHGPGFNWRVKRERTV